MQPSRRCILNINIRIPFSYLFVLLSAENKNQLTKEIVAKLKELRREKSLQSNHQIFLQYVIGDNSVIQNLNSSEVLNENFYISP